MNIVLLFPSCIMFIYWVLTVCRCMKPHHYLGLAAITVSTWRNSHLSKVLTRVLELGSKLTSLNHAWSLGLLVSSLEMSFQVPALVEEEYFSCVTESEGRGLAKANVQSVLGLSQGDPLSQSQSWIVKGIQNISPICLVQMEDCLTERPNDISVAPNGRDGFRVVFVF